MGWGGGGVGGVGVWRFVFIWVRTYVGCYKGVPFGFKVSGLGLGFKPSLEMGSGILKANLVKLPRILLTPVVCVGGPAFVLMGVTA